MKTLKHNLLYLIPEEEYTVDKELAKDLRLKESFSFEGMSEAETDYLIKILLSPVKNKVNLEYRREIINEFLSVPEMFNRIFTSFNNFNKEIRSRQSEFNGKALNYKDFNSSKNMAQLNCIHFTKDLLLIRDIEKCLCKYNFNSRGLNELKKRISGIVNNPEYIKLIDILKLIETSSAEDEFNMYFELGEMGRMKDYDIIDFEEEQEYTARSFFRRIKTEINVTAEATLTDKKNEYLSKRFNDISSAVIMMDKMIYSEFSTVAEQLSFYNSALKFIHFVKEKLNLPVVFPERSDCTTEISSLYDINLLVNGKKAVPNDISIPYNINGMVIRGDNSSGKTVFIRSVGTAQLMFSAGLPIAAEKAAMRLVNGIYSQFSSSEKKSAGETDSGRFEQEVMVFSSMFERIKPDSLVILNESFQTTEYSEGAEGLYHILKAINFMGSKWILVTHLKEIFNLFNDKNTSKYEMLSDGSHKIKRAD